jgi:hypothetical protein
MRARNIKPGFFKNEELAEIPPMGRLIFIGLWCMADRAGRLEDRPRRVRAEIAPYDALTENELQELLGALETRGFIIRYSIGENRYIQIVNFTKHQHINIKESESIIPAPCQHPTNTPEYPILNTEYPILNTEEKICAPDGAPAAPTTAPSRFSARQYEKDFDEKFYPAYPKKRDPVKAKVAYLKQAKKGNLPEIEVLLAILEEQKKWDDWIKDGGKFIPYPATWLNGERWRDSKEVATRSPFSKTTGFDALKQSAERRAQRDVE